MKKSLAITAALTCMLGLCSCGSNVTTVAENPLMTPEAAAELGETTVNNMDMIVKSGMIEQYADDDVSYNGLVGWQDSLEEIGEFGGVTDVHSDISSDEAIIDVTVDGSIHDAVVQLIMTPEGCTGISTNIQYSFGELMEKAALNTLIGMGTVFVVLILISLIISAFNLIPKIQEKFSKNKTEAEEIKVIREEAVDNTIARIVKQEDDLELVAVITAAIAASEGAAGTDGFVVRSIRKRA